MVHPIIFSLEKQEFGCHGSLIPHNNKTGPIA